MHFYFFLVLAPRVTWLLREMPHWQSSEILTKTAKLWGIGDTGLLLENNGCGVLRPLPLVLSLVCLWFYVRVCKLQRAWGTGKVHTHGHRCYKMSFSQSSHDSFPLPHRWEAQEWTRRKLWTA